MSVERMEEDPAGVLTEKLEKAVSRGGGVTLSWGEVKALVHRIQAQDVELQDCRRQLEETP